MMKNSESPLPRSSVGNAWSTSTVADGISSAPPMPWSVRNPIIHASAASPSGVRPQSSDEIENSSTPATTIRWWPKMSPRRPASATNAAVASAYAVTTHWAPAGVRPTSAWIVVSEMETIVKSIITIAMAGTSGHMTR